MDILAGPFLGVDQLSLALRNFCTGVDRCLQSTRGSGILKEVVGKLSGILLFYSSDGVETVLAVPSSAAVIELQRVGSIVALLDNLGAGLHSK